MKPDRIEDKAMKLFNIVMSIVAIALIVNVELMMFDYGSELHAFSAYAVVYSLLVLIVALPFTKEKANAKK